MGLSDVQQIGVDLQSTVGIVGQNLLGQNLTQLDAFLVEGVDVPGKALVHNLVLEVGQQSTNSSRSQLLTDDDGAGTAAGELLVVVSIILAAGKGNDLCSNVGAQLLLGGRALDDNVGAHLAVAEADKLQRRDVSALVQQLIEGVLTVGAGLTEDDGTGNVVHGLAEAVDRLAVGLHVQLLQMSGETAQSLGVGQNSGSGVAQNVTLVNADQSVQQSGVLQQVGIGSQLVSLCGTVEEVSEDLGTEGQARTQPPTPEEEEKRPPMSILLKPSIYLPGRIIQSFCDFFLT